MYVPIYHCGDSTKIRSRLLDELFTREFYNRVVYNIGTIFYCIM